MKNKDTQFIDSLQEAYEKFLTQFDNWAFDERDCGANDLSEYVEKLLGREMTDKEKKSRVFTNADKLANKVSGAAESIGYCHRLADQMNPNYGHDAEQEFRKLKQKYPNF